MADDIDLSILTAEERAAVEEFQKDETEAAADAEAALGLADDDAGAEEEPDAKPAGDDGQPIPAEAANPATAAKPKAPAPEITSDMLPAIEELTEVEKARLGQIDSEIDALDDKFDAGEISREELRSQRKTLAAEKNALQVKQTTAESSHKLQQSILEKAWVSDVKSWFKDHPEVQALAEGDKEKFGTFDAMVRRLADAYIEMGMSNKTALDQVLSAFEAQHGELPGKKAPAKAEADPSPKPKKKEPNIPPTLAKIPAADIMDSADPQFAMLDKLMNLKDPTRYERELAKLSPERRDAYLAL